MDELGVSVWRAKLFLRFKFEGSNLVMNDSVHQIFLFPSFDRFCMDQGIWLKALKCFQCSQSQYILILD